MGSPRLTETWSYVDKKIVRHSPGRVSLSNHELEVALHMAYFEGKLAGQKNTPVSEAGRRREIERIQRRIKEFKNRKRI